MITIKLSSIQDVKDFINIVTKFEERIDLMNEHYKVDAKSIMGIFSMDLSKGSIVVIHTEDENVISALTDKLRKFM